MMSLEAKRVRKYLTPQELKAEIVDWSMDTLKRRIKNDGFPAVRDGNSYLIPTEEAELWFRRRKVRSL